MNEQLKLQYKRETGFNVDLYDVYVNGEIEEVPSPSYISWLEDNFIALRDKKPEKVYFLFGGDAAEAYEEGGIDAVEEAFENNEITYEAFEYDGGNVIELVAAFDGWANYVIIDEYEFKKL